MIGVVSKGKALSAGANSYHSRVSRCVLSCARVPCTAGSLLSIRFSSLLPVHTLTRLQTASRLNCLQTASGCIYSGSYRSRLLL